MDFIWLSLSSQSLYLFFQLRVEDSLIRGLKWSKLLDSNKKGQWWLSGDIASATDTVEDVANTIDKEVRETQKMLQIAAAQRMNTDARRAIFCIIMSAEDYLDAFEKLLRLDLPGKQVGVIRFGILYTFFLSSFIVFENLFFWCSIYRTGRSSGFLWTAVCRRKCLTSITPLWLPSCVSMTKITSSLYRYFL